MAYDNTITVVGNLTRDPELRFTPGGAAVANFGVAWNLKGRDGAEDKVSYFDVTCWRQLAENVSDSLTVAAEVREAAATTSPPKMLPHPLQHLHRSTT